MNGQGRTMALSANDHDKYAPRNTGLYDVVLREFKGVGHDDKD